MATQEEVELIMNYFEETHPIKFFKVLNDGNAGMGALLRYLDDAHESVTAGNISEHMHVSTARVAVLIKRMASEGYIIKENDASDARITLVRISEKGKEKARQIRSEIYEQVALVIDTLGMDKMKEFINLSEEIRATVLPLNMELR